MTRNSDTVRSLCLAALMVLSVFAGTVALSGSAAAASDASLVSLTNAADDNGNDIPDVPGGTTVQHTLTYDIDDVSADGDTDTISITIPAGSYESLDNLTVTNRTSGEEISVTGSPTVSNDGRTVSFDISPDADADGVDVQVEAQFTANWPAVSQNVSGPVNTSVADSGNADLNNSTLATVEILSTGTVAPEDTAALNSGDTFYTGQEVFVEGLTADEEYRVREVDDDGEVDTLRQTLTADGDGAADFELSAGLSDGDFVLVDSAGNVVPVDDGVAQPAQPAEGNNVTSAAFEVIAMDLTAEFDDDSVGNDGTSATVDYEVESDVRNDYTVNVSAEGLDVDDLEDIFGGDATVVNTYDDDDIVEVTQSGSDSAEGTYELDFDDIDAGNYTFEANVTDADASDADSIEVTETGDPSAEFNESIYTEQRGDVANISVVMESTDTATLQVGDVDDGGYAVVAEVEDDDDDGVAYVEFNSFTAGNNTTTLTAGDEDTSVSNVTNPDGSFDGNNPLGSDLLNDGDYDMFITEGEKDSSDIAGDADDRATLRLTEASVDGMQIWTAPDDSLDELREVDAEDIPEWAAAGNLTQTDTIARNDTLVVQVEASGLEGALELGDATTVYNDTSAASQLLNLTFESDSGALNQEDEGDVNVADIGTDNYDVVYDGANDAHYVVIDSGALTEEFDYDDGDEYTANFSVFEEDTDLVDDTVSVTSEFTVEDPELELDANADDEIVLEAAAGQEITGTTNLAPGTDVEVAIESETSTDPFVKRPEATVQRNGSYTAVADFSDNSAGSEFTAQAVVDDVDSNEYDGELVAATGGNQTPTDGGNMTEETPGEMTEETPGEMTEETPATAGEETPGGGMGETPAAESPTAGSGPGFTAALALIALVAAALLAVRRHD